MPDDRFVCFEPYIIEHSGKKVGGMVWGLWLDQIDEFIMLYSTGNAGDAFTNTNYLFEREKNEMVDADESCTPDEAWAALALYRLGIDDA